MASRTFQTAAQFERMIFFGFAFRVIEFRSRIGSYFAVALLLKIARMIVKKLLILVFILAFPSPVDMFKGDFLTLSCFIEVSAALYDGVITIFLDFHQAILMISVSLRNLVSSCLIDDQSVPRNG